MRLNFAAGLVDYEGYGSKIVFEDMSFDHNFATSGGVAMIDGRYDKMAGGIEILVSNCFFYENCETAPFTAAFPPPVLR